MEFLDIVSLACLIAACLFFAKSWEKKDLSYMAQGLSRVYLGTVVFVGTHYDTVTVSMNDVRVALLVVILSDIIAVSIFLMGRKYLRGIEYAKATEHLKNLQDKFALVVENSPIGFFTLDTSGKFEFSNGTLRDILETEHLTGKNIFDFMEKETTSGILVLGKFSYPNVKMITGSGKTIKVQLVGGATQNGHKTITGSVHPL
jgi:PAS domain-containing protein